MQHNKMSKKLNTGNKEYNSGYEILPITGRNNPIYIQNYKYGQYPKYTQEKLDSYIDRAYHYWNDENGKQNDPDFLKIIANKDLSELDFSSHELKITEGPFDPWFDNLERFNLWFVNCQITGVELRHMKFNKCVFRHCYLDECDFTNTVFNGCTFHHCMFKNAIFSNNEFHKTMIKNSVLPDRGFINCDFDNMSYLIGHIKEETFLNEKMWH